MKVKTNVKAAGCKDDCRLKYFKCMGNGYSDCDRRGTECLGQCKD